MTGETTPLLTASSEEAPKLYSRRWGNLVLFSTLSLFQCAVWVTYSCVYFTAMEEYNIPMSTINLLSAFGPIIYFPFSLHSSWAIEALGLRKTVVAASIVVALGAVIRGFAVTDQYFFLVYIGQILNAAAGPIVMTVSPALSANWFGPQERTLATGICTTSNNIGTPIAFFIGTFVTDRSSFFNMLWGEAIFGVVLCIVIIIFYSDKPPTPPSISKQLKEEQTMQKYTVTQFLKESWQVVTDPNCFNIIFTTFLTAGSNSGWGTMIIALLAPLHFSQFQSQWVGFFSGIVGVLGGILIGKFHDHFHNFKWIIFSLYCLAAVSYLYFTLATSILLQYFMTPYWGIVLVTIIGSLALNGLYPLGYESLSEMAYPAPEIIGAGLISFVINLGCVILLMAAPQIPLSWVNWMLTISCAVSAIITLFLRQKYRRLDVDASSVTVKIN